jgi:hypothetical protein
MKLCQITRENYSVFEPFIPDKLGHIRNDRRCLSLGFYEDKTPMGAVILLANNTVLEVRSLEHMPEVENGICEKELADFVVDQNWPGIYKIEYIVGGTEDFLKEYDFIMLDIGFFPMDSDVRKFSAPLYDIVKAQGQTVNSFKIAEGHREDSQYVLGKNLTKHQLDSYNNMYPYNRYYPDEKNKELSCFLIKNGEPVAGITIAEVDDGKLEFQWMDARGQTPQEIMKLLFHTLVNALEKYPRGTEVIICPFTEEVKSLISRFGFSETPENIRTRVYSYYL